MIKSRTSASSHRSIFAVPSGRSEHTDDTDGEEDLLLIGPPKELAVSKEKDSLHYIFFHKLKATLGRHFTRETLKETSPEKLQLFQTLSIHNFTYHE